MSDRERLLKPDDLKRMAPEAVFAALQEGRLRHLLDPSHQDDLLEAQAAGRLRHLGIEAEPAAAPSDGEHGWAQVRAMTPSEVRAALLSGDLDALLSGRVS